MSRTMAVSVNRALAEGRGRALAEGRGRALAVTVALGALLALSPAQAQDLNGDGATDVLDLQAMVSHIQGVEPLEDADAADLDGDGEVTVRDVVLLLKPIQGCEQSFECGPGATCQDGRCEVIPHHHGLRSDEVPDGPEPNNEPVEATCCASAALRIALEATSNPDGELTVGPDFIDYTFAHACLGRFDDDPALVDQVWLQPARDLIARGRHTEFCDQLQLDDASGERRIENLNCETTLRFRTGGLPPGNTSDQCAALVGVEDPGPGPGPTERCGGIPDCFARSWRMVVPEINADYATRALAMLFPDKEIEATEDGEVQVRLLTTDGSELVVQKADGALEFRDARMEQTDASGISTEEAIAAANAFIEAHPMFFGPVAQHIVATGAQPEFNAYLDSPRTTSVQVNIALGVEGALGPPGQGALLPVVGWHLRFNIDGDGEVTGLVAAWAPSDLAGGVGLEEAPPLPVTTEDDVRAALEEIDEFEHAGVMPRRPEVFYRRTAGTLALDLAYALDAHAPLENSSAHSHNLRTWWPATEGQLTVSLIAPGRTLDEADPFEIDGPVRFTARAQGGTPPYTYTWRFEDAVVGSRQRFPEDFPRTMEGEAVMVELAPEARTEVRVVVTDASGRVANDRGLVITGLEATPGEVVDGGEVPATPESPPTFDEGAPYRCPVPDPDKLNLAQRVAGYGWSAQAVISESDGLELSNTRFQNSRLAARMSLPFYKLTTARMEETRCELGKDPGDPDKPCRAVLMEPGLRVTVDQGPFVSEDLVAAAGTLRSIGRVEARACWCVENLGEAAGQDNDAILHICHVFKFHAEGEGCSPDPSGVACAKWEPTVEYVYQARDTRAAGFRRLVGFQRHDYELDARIRQGDRPSTFVPIVQGPNEVVPTGFSDGDIATFNQDHDDVRVVLPGLGVGPVPPLQTEAATTMAVFGAPGQNDAHHELGQVQGVFTTVIIPGCTLILNHLNGYQCLHSHWRWGAFIDEYFLFGDATAEALGDENARFGFVPGINGILSLRGKAIIPPGSYGFGNVLVPSTQKVTVHAVKFGSNEFEADPGTLGGETLDPAGRSQDQQGVERSLREGLSSLLGTIARGVLRANGVSLETEETVLRAAGKGFNALAEAFFAPFRLNVRGADLVTWYEVGSIAPGKPQRPEILQKNAHYFFR